MYEDLKSLVKFVLPKSVLEKNKSIFRSAVALWYRGNNYQCNICGIALSRFVHLENGDLLCPNCGSLPRTRRLFQIIEKEMYGQSVLHFSAPAAFRSKLKSLKITKYISTDFENEFEADKQLDICNIDEPDESYDIIICYHVLEHIVADIVAMSELYRVLSKGGKCFIQTPFKDGAIYENYDIVDPKDRLIHFGQSDHVRIYSLESLKTRLEQVGFSVKILHFDANPKVLGLKSSEHVLLAQK